MATKLHFSDDLYLPADFVTQTQAVLAKRGKGKTYAAHVQAEELTKHGLPWVAIDGVGVWYGLRAGKGGTKAGGLPVLVLGGEHGDIPLEPGAGDVVAEFVIQQRQPTVLDVSEFSNRKMIDFVAAFCETLYAKNRDALHVFLEEADMFAPQVARYPGEELTLGAIDKMVRRGRQRGLGITLISQRPAVIHKNPLTQTEMMTVLGFTSPQDVAAIADWFKVHGVAGDQLAEVLGGLPRLEKGQAYVSSPDWLKFFGRVQVREKETFDSSATPKPGAANARPRSLADVPLTDLQGRMRAAVEQKKANDPAALRRRVAELERQLAQRPAETVEKIVEKVVEVPVLKNGQLDRTEKHAAKVQELADRFLAESAELRRLIAPAAAPRPAPPAPRLPPPRSQPVPAARVVKPAPRAEGDATVGKCARAVLSVLSQFPEGCEIGKLTLLTGYRNSGGFKNALSELRTAGYIVGENTGTMRITDEGMAQGPFDPLPQGRDLIDYWLNHRSFGACARSILGALIEHPGGLAIDQLCELTGYQNSGGFKNALSELRTAGVMVGRNTETMRLSDELLGALA